MLTLSNSCSKRLLSLLLGYLATWLLGCFANAQELNINTDLQTQTIYDNAVYNQNTNAHSSIKPFRYNDFNEQLIDSIKQSLEKNIVFKKNRFLTTHAAHFATPKSLFFLDPLFNYTNYTKLKSKTNGYEASIGVRVGFSIVKKIGGEINILFSNSKFPDYINQKIQQTNVVPGQGYAHAMSNGGYRYFTGSGYISYTPSKHFNVQLGHDKQFIGDGYRTLLLGNTANNYDFLKITTTVWKIKYINLYTKFREVGTSAGDRNKYHVKFGTFHYLDIPLLKRVSIGLFESIIWNSKDSTSDRGFDVSYLNPIIFFRPVEFSIGSPDNVLLGFNLKVRHFGKNFLYGQLMLDEFLLSEIRAKAGWWGNKQAFQVGLKGFDLFGIKDLYYQGEFNFIRPYTYTHVTLETNYGHFNEPLAHPGGANLMEGIGIIRYRFNKFFVEGKMVYSVYGSDGNDSISYGQDVFKSYLLRPSEYGHTTLQGVRNTMIYTELKMSYLLNPAMNLRLEGGITIRRHSVADVPNNGVYIFVGIRTSLMNNYYDY